MRHGIDTGFLVAVELVEHPEHVATRDRLRDLISAGDRLALAPQVLAEFIHIATDGRRFERPLEMDEARRLSEQWWTAREVDQVFLVTMPCGSSSTGCKNIGWVANGCSTRYWPRLTGRLVLNRC